MAEYLYKKSGAIIPWRNPISARVRKFIQRERDLQRMERRMQMLRDHAESPGASRLSGMPFSPSPVVDDMAERVADYCDLYAEYTALWDQHIDEKEQFASALERLRPLQEVILRYRYIEYRTWEWIAQRIHYSARQAQRIHNQAIEILCRPDDDVASAKEF